jgi:hypothetical protein
MQTTDDVEQFYSSPNNARTVVKPPMSTARVIWLIWCLGWTSFWVIFGWFLPFINLVFAAGSIAAIWIPVGKARTRVEVNPDAARVIQGTVEPRNQRERGNE